MQPARRKRSGVRALIWIALPGLQDMQFFDRFEHDIGNLAHPVAAIGFYTADIQVRKIIIRTAFLSRDADFGRSRVVVHFDEETGHQFFCLVACQRTVGNAPFS